VAQLFSLGHESCFEIFAFFRGERFLIFDFAERAVRGRFEQLQLRRFGCRRARVAGRCFGGDIYRMIYEDSRFVA